MNIYPLRNIIILLVSFFHLTISCACHGPCPMPTLEQAFDRAASVFYGTVAKRVDGGLTDQLSFQVLKRWKGSAHSVETVTADSNTCDPLGDAAQVGDRFLIFAVTQNTSKTSAAQPGLAAGFCTGSVKFGGNVKEQQYFIKLDQLAINI